MRHCDKPFSSCLITFAKCMALLFSFANTGPFLYSSVSQTSSENPKMLVNAHSWATLPGILTLLAPVGPRSLHFLERGF